MLRIHLCDKIYPIFLWVFILLIRVYVLIDVGCIVTGKCNIRDFKIIMEWKQHRCGFFFVCKKGDFLYTNFRHWLGVSISMEYKINIKLVFITFYYCYNCDRHATHSVMAKRYHLYFHISLCALSFENNWLYKLI